MICNSSFHRMQAQSAFTVFIVQKVFDELHLFIENADGVWLADYCMTISDVSAYREDSNRNFSDVLHNHQSPRDQRSS